MCLRGRGQGPRRRDIGRTEIDQHGLERRGQVARFRWRQSFDQRFKHVLDAFAGFGNVDGWLAVEANDLFDLLADAIGSADGKSILFRTGTTSWSASMAR